MKTAQLFDSGTVRGKIEGLELGAHAEAHVISGLLKLAGQERNGHGLGIVVIAVLDGYRVRLGEGRAQKLLHEELAKRYDELCGCFTNDSDILRDAAELYTGPRR